MGAQGGVGHRHQPRQPFAQLGRALELPGAPPVLRDLPQGVGGGVRPERRCARLEVLELPDPVLEPGQLGQGGAQPALLAEERAVHGQDEGRVGERGGGGGTGVEGMSPQRLEQGEQGRLGREAEGHRQGLRDREGGDQDRHERPDREAPGADDLTERVHRHDQEAVEGEGLCAPPPLQAREEGRRRHPQADPHRVRDLQVG